MSSSTRRLVGTAVSTAMVVLAIAMAATLGSAQPPPAQRATSSTVPEGQTYIGSKQCAACHFDQFLLWRKTKHAQAFEILPARYKADSSCLQCHTTGHGQPSGYKNASTASLAGTTCEACHGPGSKHAEVTKQFAKKKKLSAEEDKIARGSIHLILPTNICASCHADKGHKPHPKYEKQ